MHIVRPSAGVNKSYAVAFFAFDSDTTEKPMSKPMDNPRIW